MGILNHEFRLFLICARKTNLKYLVVGGYAVNFHGYARNTRDMDVWLQPSKENQIAFIQTLLCMNYTEQEVTPLYKEDFEKSFKATIGPYDASLDLLTFFHSTINFDEAYLQKEIYEIEEGVFVDFVSYEILKDMKLRSRRDIDLWDVARLDEIKKQKSKK